MTGAHARGAPGADDALAGVGVAVTRGVDDAGPLADALARRGARVVVTPLVRIEPIAPDAPARDALAAVDTYDWIALTSRHAVGELARALARLGRAGARPARPRVAAVGAGTADAARAHGWPVALVPARHDAAALAQAMAGAAPLRGARVLFPRAAAARDTLPAALRAAGAEVTEVTLYRTVADAPGAAALRAHLLRRDVAVVTLASGSAAHALVERVGVALAARTRLVSIGAVTAAAVRSLGLDVVAEASEASVAGIVAAVVAASRDLVAARTADAGAPRPLTSPAPSLEDRA